MYISEGFHKKLAWLNIYRVLNSGGFTPRSKFFMCEWGVYDSVGVSTYQRQPYLR